MKNIILIIHKYLSIFCMGLGVVSIICLVVMSFVSVKDDFTKSTTFQIIQTFCYAYSLSFILTNLTRDEIN